MQTAVPGHIKRLSVLPVLGCVLVASAIAIAANAHADGRLAPARQTIQAPVLKWQNGGCYSSWCETGWYSSPAVVDVDQDGGMEVIGATYSLFVLNGNDGSVKWTVNPDGSRVWPGVVVADLDADGDIEIVTAHGGGYVNVFDPDGTVVWSRRPAGNEFRSLAVADLESDGDLEIVVGLALLDRDNVWVLEHTGQLRAGWPRLGLGEGSAAGLYNDNIGIGDLNGDGVLEVIVPSDTITICAYEPDGTQLPTHSMYHDHPGHDMDYWGEVPVYVGLEYETRGWGPCYTEATARANFADGPANVVDVDGDGTNEVVVIGDVHDCHTSPYTDLYNGPYIFNSDRTRFKTASHDWTAPPVPPGAPLIQNYNVIESVQPNPTTVDLDGDGNLEIVYPSYDGRVHAIWLDKSEHGSWPYSVYNPGEGIYRFASEAAVADLDDDGSPEVIFGSWVQKGTYRTGRLHILDHMGNPIHEVDLPSPYGSADWNGALAAPTLANIDGDPDLEVVLNTSHSGLVAYDLPGTADARIHWGTGRGSYGRTGALPYASLEEASVSVSPTNPAPGDPIRYTIFLNNPGPALRGVRVTDTLPADVTYLGDLWASSGSFDVSGGTIRWWGTLFMAKPVTIRFSAEVSNQITTPRLIENTVLVDDGRGHLLSLDASAMVNGFATFLPIVAKH